jgi:prepilin-type N-terminal cleavage/methylation domain-containing protein
MKKQKGFSLIELLIVVAIILIIAAIAIPNLMRARMSANEASAVGSIRTINTSQVQYSSTYGVGFADTLGKLGGLPATCATSTGADVTHACLIDNVLAVAVDTTHLKSGYYFTPSGGGTGAPATYTIVGQPGTPGQSGQRGFYSDQSGVIRFTSDGTAPNSTSTALQ